MAFDDFIRPLRISRETVSELAVDFAITFRHLALNSEEQFLATAINVLPRGKEKGRFLALDVGGSNLRVCFIELLGPDHSGRPNLRRTYDRSWPIEDRFKVDNADDLFAWIGSCILGVVEACQEDLDQEPRNGFTALGDVLPIGVAWSFPMIQNSIDEATLMPMGKGFAVNSKLGLGKLLLAGYNAQLSKKATNGRRIPKIEVAAITNDTVSTFASLAYYSGSDEDQRVVMGLIVGTGTNAAIVMEVDALHPKKTDPMILPAKLVPGHQSVMVNTEWTISGAAPPLKKHGMVTSWDVELDKYCEIPGFQPFEYMAGGRYLGELARLILYDYFVHHQKADAKGLPPILCTRNALSTFFLSTVIAPSTSSDALSHALHRAVPPPEKSTWRWTTERAAMFKSTTDHIRDRSAKMVAAAVVGSLITAGCFRYENAPAKPSMFSELIVAYTGGVISQFCGYLEATERAIDEIIQDITHHEGRQRIVLREVQNGSIVGVGVLAGTVWNLDSPAK